MAERGENLVVCRTGERSKFLKRNYIAKKLDLGTYAKRIRRNIGHIQGHKIHRDPPHDRYAHARYGAAPLVADGAHEAVCISQPGCCERRWPRRAKGGSVANALPSVNAPQLEHPARQDRDDIEGICLSAAGISSVQPNPRTYEIECVCFAKRCARRGSEACRSRRQLSQRRP